MDWSSYDELGEFHDLFMTEAWDGLRPLIRSMVAGLKQDAVVVEVGAGSGLGTRVLGEECRAQIVALEPNLLMRSTLTARVADDPQLAQRVTVVAGSAPQDLALLPDTMDAVVCTHMLGHLDPAERRALFAWVAATLSPDGIVLVTTQDPADAGDHGDPDNLRPSDLLVSRRLGRYEYRLLYRETPARDSFSSRYEVWDATTQIRAVEVIGPWRTVGVHELENDIEGTGLTVTPLGVGTALIRRFPSGPSQAGPGHSRARAV